MLSQIELPDHIADARKQAFGSPLLDKYAMEFVAEDELWKCYIPELFAYYPRDLFFMKDKLVQDEVHQRLELLKKAAQPALQIVENILVRDIETNAVVGLYHGLQKDVDSYCMEVSAVHRDYRRAGIYSALVDRVILYTKILGFSTVLSCHSPANNAVLVAKLKKNFKVTSLEVDGLLGVNLWLCYFHNRELQRAYEMRCGHIAFSREMFQASLGTAEEFLGMIERAASTDEV